MSEDAKNVREKGFNQEQAKFKKFDRSIVQLTDYWIHWMDTTCSWKCLLNMCDFPPPPPPNLVNIDSVNYAFTWLYTVELMFASSNYS